jgi:MFS family permease
VPNTTSKEAETLLPTNDPQKAESELSYYGWVVVSMCLLANLVAFGCTFSYGVFLKSFASEFGWSRSLIAGAFSIYAIFHNLLAFFAGATADRLGPRPLMTVAGSCLGLSMVVMSRANSIWDLYVLFGVIFSVGVAATYSPAMATVSLWFKAKRGLAIGLTAAGLGAGSLVFSPLSAWLILLFGWRTSYLILGIIAWVIFIPIVVFVRRAPPELAFAKVESESIEGLSFSEAFKTGTFWALCYSFLFHSVAAWTIMIHIVALATDRGISIVMAGSIAGLIGGASLPGRIGAGFLSDRIGRKRVFLSALTFQLVTIVWLLFSREVWMLLLFAIVFGISSGGVGGLLAAFPADYFGHKATGAILGFLAIMAGIGIALGPYLGGYIFDATGSYDYVIVMCIMATIATIISASLLKPVRIAPRSNLADLSWEEAE